MPADPAILDRLRRRIARLERMEPTGSHGPADDAARLSFGLAALDDHLPWGGLPTGCMHEIIDGDAQLRNCHSAGSVPPGGAATAFAAALAGRRQWTTNRPFPAPIVWIAPRHGLHESLYRHGLAAFGLDPDALLVVRIPGNGRPAATQTLWALEETLRERAIGLVCAELDTLDLAASRRLQLAAAAGGTTGLLLRGGSGATAALPPTASVTRWRVASAPSTDPGIPCWRVELLRVRNGRPRRWLLEWRYVPVFHPDIPGRTASDECPATGFALAAALRDRPDMPPQRRLAAAPGETQHAA